MSHKFLFEGEFHRDDVGALYLAPLSSSGPHAHKIRDYVGDFSGWFEGLENRPVRVYAEFLDEEKVNDPKHYDHPSGVKCHQICGGLPFYLGNAIKYLWRSGKKSAPEEEELRKALWYIDRERARLQAMPSASRRAVDDMVIDTHQIAWKVIEWDEKADEFGDLHILMMKIWPLFRFPMMTPLDNRLGIAFEELRDLYNARYGRKTP